MKKTLLMVSTLALLTVPASAHHFSLIGGSCFNPAGNLIPAIAAISNPHCLAVGYEPPYNPPNGDNGKKPTAKKSSNSNAGKLVVACVMGSAIGLISASIIKARRMGFQYRWLSQVEFEQSRPDPRLHLTPRQAAMIGFSCGILTPLALRE